MFWTLSHAAPSAGFARFVGPAKPMESILPAAVPWPPASSRFCVVGDVANNALPAAEPNTVQNVLTPGATVLPLINSPLPDPTGGWPAAPLPLKPATE